MPPLPRCPKCGSGHIVFNRETRFAGCQNKACLYYTNEGDFAQFLAEPMKEQQAEGLPSVMDHKYIAGECHDYGCRFLFLSGCQPCTHCAPSVSASTGPFASTAPPPADRETRRFRTPKPQAAPTDCICDTEQGPYCRAHKVMTTQDWLKTHTRHLAAGTEFKTKKGHPHLDDWRWLICPCGAEHLTTAAPTEKEKK